MNDNILHSPVVAFWRLVCNTTLLRSRARCCPASSPCELGIFLVSSPWGIPVGWRNQSSKTALVFPWTPTSWSDCAGSATRWTKNRWSKKSKRLSANVPGCGRRTSNPMFQTKPVVTNRYRYYVIIKYTIEEIIIIIKINNNNNNNYF